MSTDVDDEVVETHDQDRDVTEIREAESNGWAPIDRWRGDPKDWIDAGEFNRRTRQHLPIIKSQLKKEREKAAQERAEYESRSRDFERRLQAQARVHERALELQKVQLAENFENERRAALAIQDPHERQRTYDNVARRERDAAQRFAKVDEEIAAPLREDKGTTPFVPPEMEQWGRVNKWFQADESMRNDAIRIMDRLDREEADLPLTEKLAKVTETIKDLHPDWFPAKRTSERETPKVQAVESGGSMRGSATPRARGYKDIPPEARAACADLQRRGILRARPGEEVDKARARIEKEYAETYWQEYGE